MKGNRILYPVAVLVIVIAIIVVSDKLGDKKPAAGELQFFPSLSAGTIGSITIRDENTSIRVRRQGDVWVVSKADAVKDEVSAAPHVADSAKSDSTSQLTDSAQFGSEFPVDSAAIAVALEKIIGLRKDALISENPEKQSIFQVDTVKGLTVQIADNSGKQIGTVIIGKSGADYSSHYVRAKGSNSVYMAGGSIKYSFFTDIKQWRNKSILKFDKSTAKGITLAKFDGDMITLAQADSGNPWQILQPINSPAKTDAVEAIIDKLCKLNATDFQDETLADTAMGFDKPELGVTISFKNGSSRNIMFGKKNSDKKYWVKTDGKEQIYLVGEYVFNQINKKLDDLKGEPLVKPVEADTLKTK